MRLDVVSVTDGVSKIEVTVDVAETFKNSVQDPFVLSTSDGCCSCTPSFEIARTCLFVAHRSEGKLEISGCSRTKLMTAANAELEFLKNSNGEVGCQ